MTNSIHGLINNAALLITLVLLYDILTLRQVDEKTSVNQAFTGIMLGIIGIAIMSNPWEFTPGVVFDTRSILLCITGFFFGTLPAIITILITGCYRLFLGGTGAWTGVAVIVTSGLVGLAWRHKRKKSIRNISMNEFYTLGMVVHILMLLWMLTLPWAIAMSVLSKIAIPVLLIFPIGTALIAQLMSNRHANKLIKRELKKSERNYRSLIESQTDLVCRFSPNGTFLFVNEVYVKFFNKPKKELVGSRWQPLPVDDDIHLIEAELSKLAPDNPTVTIENRVFSGEGEIHWMQFINRGIFDSDGNLMEIQSVGRDITERKQAQEALKKKTLDIGERIKELNCLYSISKLLENQDISLEKIFQKIVNLMPLSWQYPEITCSRVIFKNQEYVSDNFKETIWKQSISILVRGQKKGIVETCYLKEMPEIDEGPFFKEERDLINEIAERIGRYIENIQADEKRYKTEEELQESEEKYRSMMESMDEGIYICSPGFHIEYMNPAMIKRIGYDAVGEPCHNVMHGLDDKCPWCVFEKVTLGEFINYEIVSPKDNRTYNISNSPIFHNDGSISKLTMFRDITELKKMEQRLQQSQKMESIGTLAGGIAHDFNNILFPIIGHSEMLLEDIPEESQFRDGLNQIYTSALRAKDMVKQILTFSRQEIAELKLVKMQHIIKEALKLIRSTIPTTIEIKQNIQTDCGAVKADPTQIHQIIMNLATNAYHAMEETGGELDIRLKEVEFGELDLFNPDIKLPQYARLSISDTGKGMDKDTIKKIFDPFFTTKETGKGTGMGLSVVHGIIKSMNGTIKVDSRPDKGTEFHIYLPLAEAVKEQQQTTNEASYIQNGTEHILLVDDEKVIIKMEQNMLERLGYKVTSRSSSIEALEAFRASSDKFDIVITDMQMPNMSGDKLASELTKIRPDIPILLCTGFSETMSEEKAESLGINGFLLKPIVMKNLSHKIREVLDNTAHPKL